jgi:hypothetical protein
MTGAVLLDVPPADGAPPSIVPVEVEEVPPVAGAPPVSK